MENVARTQQFIKKSHRKIGRNFLYALGGNGCSGMIEIIMAEEFSHGFPWNRPPWKYVASAFTVYIGYCRVHTQLELCGERVSLCAEEAILRPIERMNEKKGIESAFRNTF